MKNVFTNIAARFKKFIFLLTTLKSCVKVQSERTELAARKKSPWIYFLVHHTRVLLSRFLLRLKADAL